MRAKRARRRRGDGKAAGVSGVAEAESEAARRRTRCRDDTAAKRGWPWLRLAGAADWLRTTEGHWLAGHGGRGGGAARPRPQTPSRCRRMIELRLPQIESKLRAGPGNLFLKLRAGPGNGLLGTLRPTSHAPPTPPGGLPELIRTGKCALERVWRPSTFFTSQPSEGAGPCHPPSSWVKRLLWALSHGVDHASRCRRCRRS